MKTIYIYIKTRKTVENKSRKRNYKNNKREKFMIVITSLLESPKPRDEEEAHAMALGGKN